MFLEMFKKLFFRARKHKRYQIHNGSFVIIVPNKDGGKSKWKVQVIDISVGGAAFIYPGSPSDLAESGIVKLSNQTLNNESVKFETISDIKAPGWTDEIPYRRRGVKFEWGGVLSKNQVDDFIKEYGLYS
jgi:hypothetical protein